MSEGKHLTIPILDTVNLVRAPADMVSIEYKITPDFDITHEIKKIKNDFSLTIIKVTVTAR